MLTDTLHAWLVWVLANKTTTFAVVVWLVANVAPRPHPENLTGWKKSFWMLVNRLCVLEADALPGKLKWLFAATPAAPPPPPKNDTPSASN